MRFRDTIFGWGSSQLVHFTWKERMCKRVPRSTRDANSVGANPEEVLKVVCGGYEIGDIF